MSWFVIFACTVFGLYFWRERPRAAAGPAEPVVPAPHRRALHRAGADLVEGLRDGSGQVQLGNRRWTLRGPNAPAGSRVRVTGIDGTVLIVDRLPG